MFLYNKAALIISVTNSFKQSLINRGIDGYKLKMVTNGVDLKRFKPSPKDEILVEKYQLKEKFLAGYIGTHGMAHALETILEAANKIRRDNDVEDDFNFIMLGQSAKKLSLWTGQKPWG